MKDIFKVNIGAFNKEQKKTIVEYKLYAKFSEEPVFIGSQEESIYTPIGTVIWGRFLEIVNSITEVYASNPKLGSKFLNNISYDITIDNLTIENLQESYRSYLALMGEHCLDKLIMDFDYTCKKYDFIPTVNGVKFFSIFTI